jgi:hypothetical protein
LSLLDQASKKTDAADMVLMSIAETVSSQAGHANATKVASFIRGAKPIDVQKRLAKLHVLGLLELVDHKAMTYRLTTMGAELMCRDVFGWSPSPSEQARRDRDLREKASNPFRSV